MIALALAVSAAACGDPEDQSLCTVYDSYLTSLGRLVALDPNAAPADALTEALEDTIRSVRHLGQVADSRYTDSISTLEVALEDVLRVVEVQDPDADPSTWRPLVEDSAEDVRDAAFHVSELIDPSCRPEAVS